MEYIESPAHATIYIIKDSAGVWTVYFMTHTADHETYVPVITAGIQTFSVIS